MPAIVFPSVSMIILQWIRIAVRAPAHHVPGPGGQPERCHRTGIKGRGREPPLSVRISAVRARGPGQLLWARRGSHISQPVTPRLECLVLRRLGPQLADRPVSHTRGCGLPLVPRVPLLLPGIAVVVVAVGFPESRLVLLGEGEPARPLRAL